MATPFHADELRAQALAGQTANGGAIRRSMPDQHRDFFRLLPYLFVATADDDGWPIASMLAGPPGFVHSPDPTTLRIAALPAAGDPAALFLRRGSAIGLLGLDLSTRRRNRANGRIAVVDGTGLTVAVDQSFGNCAQYIQTRQATPRPVAPTGVERLQGLDAEAQRLIATADTFFVASASARAIVEGGGLDISHRGGRPGFVRIDDQTLVVPDFRGNRFFNTLGNLLGDPRAGLLFVDFDGGGLLQVQGTVTIDWSAGRSWRLAVTGGWRRRDALPFAFTFGEYAPTTLAT